MVLSVFSIVVSLSVDRAGQLFSFSSVSSIHRIPYLVISVITLTFDTTFNIFDITLFVKEPKLIFKCQILICLSNFSLTSCI